MESSGPSWPRCYGESGSSLSPVAMGRTSTTNAFGSQLSSVRSGTVNRGSFRSSVQKTHAVRESFSVRKGRYSRHCTTPLVACESVSSRTTVDVTEPNMATPTGSQHQFTCLRCGYKPTVDEFRSVSALILWPHRNSPRCALECRQSSRL